MPVIDSHFEFTLDAVLAMLVKQRSMRAAGKLVCAVIPTEACYLGWQESLTLLAQLVQPEIPG